MLGVSAALTVFKISSKFFMCSKCLRLPVPHFSIPSSPLSRETWSKNTNNRRRAPRMMHSQAVTVAPRDDYPLHTTAKRYWLTEHEAHSCDPDALTLILLHATSFHKETWEPSLERLFKLSSQSGSPINIREAWALDCPNHGAAGQLNEEALMQPEFFNNCRSL